VHWVVFLVRVARNNTSSIEMLGAKSIALISESIGDVVCVKLCMTNPIEHTEGPVARAIEEQTAKLPSDAFLWAAAASIIASLILKMVDKQHEALFVGQWAPTILILGLYNKLVKQHGSDHIQG
jgi:hypothetical protein